MPAIITDQYRILNAETFVKSFVGIGTTGKNNYYTFLAHPEPDNISDGIGYGDATWPTKTPDPIDSFDEENRYHDSMLFLKKVTSSDVRRVIPRINWQSGTVYEMYRNNYSAYNRTSQSATSGLYGSSYYVVTSEFKVYLCINNGSSPENDGEGRTSKVEPTHTSTTVPPKDESADSDNYQWKYLYTIAPSDIVKFVTDDYIPLPENWGDISTKAVKDASVNGKLETIVIKNAGTATINSGNGDIEGIPIIGDGSGGKATLKVAGGVVDSIKLSDTNSKDYTYAVVDLYAGFESGTNKVTSVGENENQPVFEVIIPPKGGHGADVYRELGGYRVMIYSKFDNNVNDKGDYIIGNTFSRVGIIKDPLDTAGTSVLNKRTATSLGALKLRVPDNSSTLLSNVVYKPNARITQFSDDAAAGIGTAVGYVASWDSTTGVLKYYQPVGFSTQSLYGKELKNFVGVSTAITGATHIEVGGTVDDLVVDTSFNGESVVIGQREESLSQTFINGVASPEIKKFSGEIIYIDNRAVVTRTASQKEEVKIVIEF